MYYLFETEVQILSPSLNLNSHHSKILIIVETKLVVEPNLCNFGVNKLYILNIGFTLTFFLKKNQFNPYLLLYLWSKLTII